MPSYSPTPAPSHTVTDKWFLELNAQAEGGLPPKVSSTGGLGFGCPKHRQKRGKSIAWQLRPAHGVHEQRHGAAPEGPTTPPRLPI